MTETVLARRSGAGSTPDGRVLRAALEVLADDGMPGFTIESVARRAGASKATVYRHWPSPSALLVDAMDAEFRPLPDVDTGDLRADLVGLLTAFASALTDSPFPKLMAAFTDAAERDPALGRPARGAHPASPGTPAAAAGRGRRAGRAGRGRRPRARRGPARRPVLLPPADRPPGDAGGHARRRGRPRARGCGPDPCHAHPSSTSRAGVAISWCGREEGLDDTVSATPRLGHAGGDADGTLGAATRSWDAIARRACPALSRPPCSRPGRGPRIDGCGPRRGPARSRCSPSACSRRVR